MPATFARPDSSARPLAPAIVWLASLAVHLSLLVAGSFLAGERGPRSRPEAERRGEIVLADRRTSVARYFTADAAEAHAVLKPVVAGAADPAAPADDAPPPLVAALALPQAIGPPAAVDSSLIAAPQTGAGSGRPRFSNPAEDAAILAADQVAPREQVPTGPTARLSLFGSLAAEGRSFVFVFDRSASMGSGGLGVISAAAKELAGRLEALTPEQTCEVIGYNEAIVAFSGKLTPATDDTKRRLVRFVSDMAAYGQTEHSRGLLAALRLRPEVIFLFTDGGEPPLDGGQLRIVRELAAPRTSIHCLHFGRGPQADPAHFLVRLAAENRGSYVYIDMDAQ
jgi:Ca-activated chloride channel family protein